MRRCAVAVAVACGAAALEVEVEVDGVSAPLKFRCGDDFERRGQDWAAGHAQATSRDCTDEACVVGALVGEMAQIVAALDGDVDALVRDAGGDVAGGCGPEAAPMLAALARRRTLGEGGAAGCAAAAHALEQLAGACLFSGALESAVQAAALALRLEPRLKGAAGFGMRAAGRLEAGMGAAGRLSNQTDAAWFGGLLAQNKRPLFDGFVVDLEVYFESSAAQTCEPNAVAFSHLSFAAVHSAAADHAAGTLRWLVARPDVAAKACRFGDFDLNPRPLFDSGPQQLLGAAHQAAETLRVLGDAAQGYEALSRAAEAWRDATFGAGDVQTDADVERRVQGLISLDKSLADVADAAAAACTHDDAACGDLRAHLAAAARLHGRAACLVPSPRLSAGAVALGAAEASEAESAFFERGVAVVDDVLTELALEGLRDFLSGSTIFTKTYLQGYVGAFLADGFGSSGLVWQVARELQNKLPNLLGNATLTQAWAYVYARSHGGEAHSRGIDAHSDDADVSINVWITADESNLARDGKLGGLVIYDAEPPKEWSFARANAQTADINALLGGAVGATQVAYKCNRATLLNGHRFHQTDALDFRPGHRHHRINLTFLFSFRHPKP
ncbi:hypothetical protein M885DRAFT_527376 [Pelagophyceae sp. CCMP2097]|nr:hypothetical protein M885DRAFT_527376 [Pelagophyceae sp. CCMP2097]